MLDRIILYLRLVHSVDFYNHGEYPHEDDMPNRCGLVHVRGPAPTSSQWGADEQTGQPLASLQFSKWLNQSFRRKTASRKSEKIITDIFTKKYVFKKVPKFSLKRSANFR